MVLKSIPTTKSIAALLIFALVAATPCKAQYQEAKLQSADQDAGDNFGASVSISGDRAIVGARFDDAGGIDAGAAYVFERDGSGAWTEKTKLRTGDIDAGDNFGTSVSISGDQAVVGLDRPVVSGAAYVYERDVAGVWTEKARLESNDIEAADNFGISVSISGNRAIVGARRKNSNAGAAYVFERDAAGVWTQQAKLQSSDINAGDNFGSSVFISGDRVIVGAHQKNSDAGAAYVFERNVDGAWTEKASLQPRDLDAFDRFGTSVSISEGIALVGAPIEGLGAAYVFERNADGTWTEQVKLQASPKDEEGQFGHSVSISGDYAAVGAWKAEESRGAAYIFERAATGAWIQKAKLLSSEVGGAANFGHSVAVSLDRAIVGASNQEFAGDGATGAAYVFERQIDVGVVSTEIASGVRLADNYPNPFKTTTTIHFRLTYAADVRLVVYDALGRKVKVLALGNRPAGTHEVSIDATGLTSGVYLYRLDAEDYVETKLMVVAK